MTVPRKNDILVGITFVLVGIIYALCDRFQMEQTIQGVVTRKPHTFDHLFVMWTLKQFLQLSLFLIWKAIDNNWIGCARFKHGERANRGNTTATTTVQPSDDVEPISLDAGPEERNPNVADTDDVQLIQDEVAPRKRKNKKASKLVYFPPAFFYLAHILLLYFGLKLTYSSSFIMLKGTVVFFTALLSLAFLSQKLACYIWFGVVMTTLGFVVSGISDYIIAPSGGYEKYGIAAGDLLILMSQIMLATKIIYEEKFIRKHSIHPLMFLGCEGMYGSVFAVTFLLVFNFVDAVQFSNLPNGRLEDVADFIAQISNSWQVTLAVFGSLLSYVLYIYLGMFLIRDLGALSRTIVETFVWGIYWSICLALHWENFFISQVPGLCVVLIGALIYSRILVLPCASRFETDDALETEYLTNHVDNRDGFDNQLNCENNEAADIDNTQSEDDDGVEQQDDVPLIANLNDNEADNVRRRGVESLRIHAIN
uniref:EamA domain-containing protein n=1 Tax=Arion vulgaris TaxID=1028688 RepID=A0A0B7A1Y0_9EUPU